MAAKKKAAAKALAQCKCISKVKITHMPILPVSRTMGAAIGGFVFLALLASILMDLGTAMAQSPSGMLATVLILILYSVGSFMLGSVFVAILSLCYNLFAEKCKWYLEFEVSE